jgi:hypothetical protein
MVFSDYMNSLPNLKVEEIKKIAELTSSSEISVYKWIAKTIDPPLVKKKIIANYLGKSVDELFPITKLEGTNADFSKLKGTV